MGVAVVSNTAGCRDTDVLKHINYRQSAETVDYDNDNKFLISNPDSQVTSESVSAVEVDRDAKPTEEKQNLVVYSSDPNATRYTAKKSLFSLDPDYNGLEASDGVQLVQTKKKEEEAVDKETADKATQESVENTGIVETSQGNGESQSKKQKDGEGASSKAKEEKPEAGEGGGSGGEVETVDTTGKYTRPPKVGTIAAYGQAAVIVEMLGGEGALVAADKELLDSEFSTVFKSQGAADITTGWKDDGSAKKIDVDAIIKSGAETVLVYSSNYQDDMKDADRKALKDAGISMTVIPNLTNSTYIKQAVTTVGEMLSEAEDIGNAGQTTDIAKAYSEFHDSVVSACVSANGGTLAGSTTYENKNRSRYSYNAGALYTLLIDYYDDSASFKGVFANNWTPECDGVGLCTYGYGSSATSFYIQAGGLINNAAEKGNGDDTGTIPAWQFSANSMNFSKDKFSYSAGGAFAKSASARGSAWSQVLFTTELNQAGNGVGSSFGTESFPSIIVGSQHAKTQIVKNSKKSDGAYHPYGLAQSKDSGILVKAFGKLVGTGICYSSIGVEGSTRGESNAFSSGQIDESAVYVNPHGLFSSWTEGSIESVLEAAWVNDEVAGNDEKVGAEDLVEQFYETFYHYELSGSQLKDIMDGE